MDAITLFSFILFATLLVVSPGPNGFLIAKTVPVSGTQAGLANVWGFVAAFFVHGSLSVFGISIILVHSSEAFFWFKVGGAIYLCWLGIKTLVAAWRNHPPVTSNVSQKDRELQTISRAFFEGFLTNVLNPKVSLFYLAAFPQFLSADASIAQAFGLVSTHAAINWVWFTAMVYAIARAKSLVTGEVVTRWLKSITGGVFIAFGAKMAMLRQPS